jgi:cyclin B
MENQSDINLKMRAILVDWLVDVCLKFDVLPHVLLMTVDLVDRYLEKKIVSRSRLQLVGVTALMIACKFEEVYPPMLKDYLTVCDNAYSKAELLQMETDILSQLKFELAQTSSYTFLCAYNECLQMNEVEFCFAQYLLENAALHVSHLQYGNSLLAAASIFFVNKLFKREGWPSKNREVTGYSEIELLKAAKDLFAFLQLNEEGDLKAIDRKFSKPIFKGVSNYSVQRRS